MSASPGYVTVTCSLVKPRGILCSARSVPACVTGVDLSRPVSGSAPVLKLTKSIESKSTDLNYVVM
jgi:hypothetical protein